MRDFLPDEVARRDWVLSTIREVYRRHHFEPIETPVLERIEVLTGKYGDEGEQLLFKVLKRGDKLSEALGAGGVRPADLVDFGLRYDLTVPLCRVVAEYRASSRLAGRPARARSRPRVLPV
jgi:histidyl-tRNA synthetase